MYGGGGGGRVKFKSQLINRSEMLSLRNVYGASRGVVCMYLSGVSG